MPTGGAFGTGTTDFFCSAVAKGSRALTQLLSNPLPLARRPRCDPRPRDLRGRTGDLDAGRAAADRPPTVVGPDHRRVGEDVRQAPGLFLGLGVLLIPSRSRSRSCSGCCSARIDLLGRVSGEAPVRGRSSPWSSARRSRCSGSVSSWPRRRARSSRSTPIVRCRPGTPIGSRSDASGRSSARSRSSSSSGSC